MQGKKKNDFALWDEAVNILYKNKEERILAHRRSTCNKENQVRLIKIHSEMQKYKSARPRGLKHIDMAAKLIS